MDRFNTTADIIVELLMFFDREVEDLSIPCSPEQIPKYIKHDLLNCESLELVKKYPCIIGFFNTQTTELCLEAVKHSKCALSMIRDQTQEICSAAIQQYPDAIQYVKK